MSLLRRRALFFDRPGSVTVRDEEMPAPQPSELLIETVVSAISAGTEMLFYRGQVPAGMTADATISGLAELVQYPLKYGYACVGRVVSAGDVSHKNWLNRLVFAFHPHESHFCAPPESLIPVPDGFSPEQAALLPNAETAVNLVMDGTPLVGERVVVMGLGIVGLLTTALLARFPLADLCVVDPLPRRRELARTLGATTDVAPDTADGHSELARADLIFELSGQPSALNSAISAAGFDSRLVVGSWYGTKEASLQLGGSFHRNRVRLISSQVSTLAPHLTGRWTKARRMESAWRLLVDLPLDELVSHKFAFAQAPDAYRQIDKRPQETLQVLLDYR